jgi:hypothetical protein
VYGGSGADAFVAKLSPSGSALVYSTYLGGNGNDESYDIAVDGSGNAYVTGLTLSSNFPTAGPLQPASGGGMGDAFVAKLNPSGSALVYSTYVGGGGTDRGNAIAVDGLGNAYVTGSTGSSDFPTASPIQAVSGGTQNDAFVAMLNVSGSALVYSTFLGGSANDLGSGIAVDGAGTAYVTGQTRASNFPTASPLQATVGGVYDAFASKLCCGRDAGLPDAGDGGAAVPDAGSPDGGDAGATPADGGGGGAASDGGIAAVPDGGTADGGVRPGGPVEYRVGCACNEAGAPSLGLFALIAGAHRRAQKRKAPATPKSSASIR